MLYGPTRSDGAAPEEPDPTPDDAKSTAARPTGPAEAATAEESSMHDRDADLPAEDRAEEEPTAETSDEPAAGTPDEPAMSSDGPESEASAPSAAPKEEAAEPEKGESDDTDPIFDRAGVSLGGLAATPTPKKKEAPVPPTGPAAERFSEPKGDESPEVADTAEAPAEPRPGHPRFDVPEKETREETAAPAAASTPEEPVATPDPLPPEEVDFRPDLETYSGPLGLLLYLIHKDEVDIFDIPISGILSQFLEHVRLLESTEQLDLQESGEYLVMAARLMEIKSRMLLPNEAEDEEELLEAEIEDPRWSLVKQLLEFREIKERAQLLEQAHRQRSQCFERVPGDLPPPEPGSLDLKETSALDLQAAFQRVLDLLRERDAMRVVPGEEIPIEVAMAGIRDQLVALPKRQQMFSEIFPRDLGLRGLVSYFMALLELTRLRHLKLEQPDDFGDILVILREAA